LSAAQPWMKFHPQDWRADEKLRLCSLAARGLWIEMLAIMHRSERYGQLLIGGKAPTDAQLAVQVGSSPDEVSELIGQLESAGVFSRAASGAIYSRRMTRDRKKADLARKNGQRGGNPRLSNNWENKPSDKGQDKGGVKATLKLRGQREEKKSKAIALPKEWVPEPFGEGTQSRKIEEGWTADQRATHLEAFRAHHQKLGSEFSNWQSAWSTWVLNTPKFDRPQRANHAEPTSYLDHLIDRERVAAGVRQ